MKVNFFFFWHKGGLDASSKKFKLTSTNVDKKEQAVFLLIFFIWFGMMNWIFFMNIYVILAFYVLNKIKFNICHKSND